MQKHSAAGKLGLSPAAADDALAAKPFGVFQNAITSD
jgi:hypothetical protein